MTAQTPFLHDPDPDHLPLAFKLIALLADRAPLHTLVLESLCRRAARGERLALVVGDNHFDAYRLARLARARGFDPAALLASVSLSRPFTCYQLHHRIAALANTGARGWNALYVIGLLDTFYDEDIRPFEAQRLVQKTLVHLKTIAAASLPVLVTMTLPHQPGRESFVELVKRAADIYWQPAPIILDRLHAQQLTLY